MLFLKAIQAQKKRPNKSGTNIDIDRYRTKLSDEEIQKVFQMTRDNLPVSEIAETVGIGYSTAYNYRRQEQRRMAKEV
jgi:DNA invertase Pin-like site-specific DNA recombinase